MTRRTPDPAAFDQRLLDLSALFEMCQTLTSSLTLGSVLENVLRIPMGHFLISRGAVLLRTPPDPDFGVEGLKGLPRDLLHKTLRVPDPPDHAVLTAEAGGSDGWISFFREFGLEIVLPLGTTRGVIGLLGFGGRIGGKPFGEREVEFLNSLSGIAATAVSNGLLLDEVRSVNQQLDRKVQQLNTIFDIGRELNTALDMKTIGSIVSFAVMGELLVNRCAVWMAAEGCLSPISHKGLAAFPSPDPSWLRLSRPEILGDGHEHPELKRAGVSVLVPMRMHEDTRGLLAVGPKLSGEPFSEPDLEFLTTLGNQAMSSLENARLFHEALDKQRMEEELRFAQGIQQDLLPKTMPEPEGYSLAAVNVPSREVGGDYYDVIRLSRTRIGVAIADVSGKGAGAALLMANVQASLRALASPEGGIAELVYRINNLMHANTALDKFVTFFYGMLDCENRTFTYCNAGHNPPLHLGASGGAKSLEEGGLLLGMFANAVYVTGSVTLSPGDRLVLYTDGISEATDAPGEEFGVGRIVAASSAASPEGAAGVLDSIMAAVNAFRVPGPPADDMTLVVVDADAAAGPPAA